MSEPTQRDKGDLPEQTSDDTDAGWSEARRADDDERFLREKPPHY